MEWPTLDRSQALQTLSAMREVLSNQGKSALTDVDNETLREVARLHELPDLSLDDLPEFDASQFKSHLAADNTKLYAARMLSVMTFVDTLIVPEKVDWVCNRADELGVHFPLLDDLKLLSQGKHSKAKANLLRRSLDRYYHISPAKFSAMVLRLMLWNRIFKDRDLIQKVSAYADKDDSLTGHHLYQYYVRNQFPLPGTGGLYTSPLLMGHDMHHILSSCGVDGAGEIEVSGFVAGATAGDPMDMLTVGFIQFHCNIKIDSPVTGFGGYRPLHYWNSLTKGTRVSQPEIVDVNWDFWPLLDKPIDDVRHSLNIV